MKLVLYLLIVHLLDKFFWKLVMNNIQESLSTTNVYSELCNFTFKEDLDSI